MRTNVDIDEELVSEVMKSFGLKTKKEAIEFSLKMAKERSLRERARKSRGKIELFEGYDK